jgi:hypothetical protein
VELRALAKEGPVALMCAEAVPWRCHRSLVADALVARGLEVLDPPRLLPPEAREVPGPDGLRIRLSDHAQVTATFGVK